MRIEVLRLVLGLAALAVVLIGAIQVLAPFVTPIIWSLVLGSATWPAYRHVRRLFGPRANLAALAMSLALVLLFLIPAGLLSLALIKELGPEVERVVTWASAEKPQLPEILDRVPPLKEMLEDSLSSFDDPEVRKSLIRQATSKTQEVYKIGRNLLGHLVDLFLTLFTLFFVYRDGEVLTEEISALLDRIASGRGRSILDAVRETVRAVFYGWLMTALAQGLVAMLGYWIVGMRSPVLLGVATGLAAVIPFGVGLVWIPAIAVLVVQGAWWQAIFLAVWSLLVVSLIDNFIRPLVISGPAKIPFILVFFGVLGGLAAYGLLGLVLGPVFLAVALALWRQAREALTEEDGKGPPPGPSADYA